MCDFKAGFVVFTEGANIRKKMLPLRENNDIQ